MSSNCQYEKNKLNCDKDIRTLIEESYTVFCKMLKDNKLTFKNKSVFFKTEMDLHNNRELGYEHIVSMKNQKMRLYEKNRMIYLPVIEPILTKCCNSKCDDIKVYRDKKDICIWCKKLDYLIVLTERKNGYLLQTAYPIIYNHKRKEVERKANENGIF